MDVITRKNIYSFKWLSTCAIIRVSGLFVLQFGPLRAHNVLDQLFQRSQLRVSNHVVIPLLIKRATLGPDTTQGATGRGRAALGPSLLLELAQSRERCVLYIGPWLTACLLFELGLNGSRGGRKGVYFESAVEGGRGMAEGC